MKLRYSKHKKKRIISPIDLVVENGTDYETTDKDLIKRLKAEGFHEVQEKKETNKKDGEK